MSAPGTSSDAAAGGTGLLALARLVVSRDLLLAGRHWDQVCLPLLFFVIITMLFPLAISPDLSELRRIAPGVVWVAAMLSCLLALEAMFRPDAEDGTLEQWVLAEAPLAWLMLAKTVAHWLVSGLPLVIVSPLVATGVGLPASAWPAMLATLAVGTATLSVLGGIGAALTVGVRRGNVLLALLVLPLEVPVLIFGARAIDLAMQGEPIAGPLNLMAAILALAVSLGPLAMAGAVRVGVES